MTKNEESCWYGCHHSPSFLHLGNFMTYKKRYPEEDTSIILAEGPALFV